MAYGIEVRNNNRQIQISEETTNYLLVDSGSFVISYVPSGSHASYTLPEWEEGDIIAIRQDAGSVYAKLWENSSTGAVNVTNIGTFAYRVYRPANSTDFTAGSGYGMEVYGPSEGLVFSTNYPSPVISNTFAVTMGNTKFVQYSNNWATLINTGAYKATTTTVYYQVVYSDNVGIPGYGVHTHTESGSGSWDRSLFTKIFIFLED